MTYRFPGPSYMERVVNLPPDSAATALDLALLDVGSGAPEGHEHWCLEVDRGRLVLELPSVRLETPALSGVCPLRRATGWIRSTVFLFPVELELFPWSSTASAVGLRPSGTRPRRLGSDIYYRVGAAGLDHLRGEMLRWARAAASARRRTPTKA
ncbi:MAG: hypothetical protein WEB06_01240 [Actinomycetota bacterium]